MNSTTGQHNTKRKHIENRKEEKTVPLTLEMLGSHHIVSATIGLAGDDGDLGHSGLSVGVQQLGAVADDTAVLL